LKDTVSCQHFIASVIDVRIWSFGELILTGETTEVLESKPVTVTFVPVALQHTKFSFSVIARLPVL